MRENRALASPERPGRLLFCSYHCYADPSSGAALSARDLLQMLGGRGWDCRVLCGPKLDFERPRRPSEVLAETGVAHEPRRCEAGPAPFSLLHWQADGIPVLAYEPTVIDMPPVISVGYPFLALLDRLLDRFRPDVLLTYGGHWIGRAIIASAKARGIPVVFWLRNCAYQDPGFFQPVDGIVVPCESYQRHYANTLGIDCTPLPSPVNWSRVQCPSVQGRYVTFVNPQPAKGLLVFARIAQELARLRPDIPLLVVEGRGDASWLDKVGIDWRRLGNVQVMPNTADPRRFYEQSRMVLMPSLWAEGFARIPVEAFINGIPVLASNRGGLPENLAEAGFLFDIAACHTPQSTSLPTAEEVAPWLRTIMRLWDDEPFYQAQRQRCLRAAERFHASQLAPRYEAFFRSMMAKSAGAGRPDGSEDVGESVLTTLASFVESPAAARRVDELRTELLEELLASGAPPAAEPPDGSSPPPPHGGKRDRTRELQTTTTGD